MHLNPELKPPRRLFSMRAKEALKNANITHVVSALRLPLDKKLFEGYEHLHIEVDDVEDENMLEWFSVANDFVRGGLEGGGGVLVHWYVMVCGLLCNVCFLFEGGGGGEVLVD